MSTRAFFGIVGWGSIALGAGYAIACSSNTEATVDAGSDALSIVLPPREASVPTGDLTSPATDAGAAPDALICPPAPMDDFRPQPFHPAKAGQGLCTAAEINAFISACVTATAADCTTWLAANVSGDNPNTAFAPGGGTPCGNCILDGKANNGGLWTDPDGLFQPNYAGCFQIEDPVNGPACGAAYNNLSGCQNFACEYCTTNAGYNQCSSVILRGHQVRPVRGRCAEPVPGRVQQQRLQRVRRVERRRAGLPLRAQPHLRRARGRCVHRP